MAIKSMTMITIQFILLLLIGCLGGPRLATAADSNPFAQIAVADYAGRFTSAKVQLRLKPDGDKMIGTIRFQGRDYTLQGAVRSGTFMGEGTDGSTNWLFTALVKGDELTFTADPESDKPNVEKLQRQRLTLPQGVWPSDKVEIHFENKGGRPSGTLKIAGHDYTFTGVLVADEVEGEFTDGRSSHPFAVRASGDDLEFDSGGNSTILASSAHDRAEVAKLRADYNAEAAKVDANLLENFAGPSWSALKSEAEQQSRSESMTEARRFYQGATERLAKLTAEAGKRRVECQKAKRGFLTAMSKADVAILDQYGGREWTAFKGDMDKYSRLESAEAGEFYTGAVKRLETTQNLARERSEIARLRQNYLAATAKADTNLLETFAPASWRALRTDEENHARGESLTETRRFYEAAVGRFTSVVEEANQRRDELQQAKKDFKTGQAYANGTGVTKDMVEAAKWYRKAAERGDADAQCELGWCYDQGCGVTKDVAESAKWVRKAAEQGHGQAQSNLGICYENGTGVSRDRAEAAKWYRKAAEQGNPWGQFNLGLSYYYGMGVKKDWVEAARWYRKAAEQGQAGAQYSLGECYRRGDGVTKDNAQADQWFRKAGANEYSSSIAKDRKAAEQGDAQAQYRLGDYYQKGNEVTKRLCKNKYGIGRQNSNIIR